MLAPDPTRTLSKVGGALHPVYLLTAVDSGHPRTFISDVDPTTIGATPERDAVWRRWFPTTVVTPPPPVTVADRGPVSISDISQASSIGLNLPAGVNLIPWTWTTSTYLSAILRVLGANDLLVLPERDEPYLIDTSVGFNGTGSFASMVRPLCRGFVGLGPGTVIQPSASSYSAPQQTSGVPSQSMIEHARDGSYMGNATINGRDLGGIAYHCLKQNGGNGSRAERLHLVAAHRGFKNSPPGETGGITGQAGSNFVVSRCVVDSLDPVTGLRVGSSNIMLNNQSNTLVEYSDALHAVAGMGITHYRVAGSRVAYSNLRYNGSGGYPKNGTGANYELCTGTHYLDHVDVITNYHNNVVSNDPTSPSPGNSGTHFSIGSSEAAITLVGTDVTVDAGPAAGRVSIQGGIKYPIGGTANDLQTASTITFTRSSDGASVPFTLYKS